MSWTKLHSKIVYSSIWSETPETCKVWITLLALADQNGFVAASRSGIARIALLDQEDVDAALATLEGPDADSSDGTTGERIEKVEGGWIVLNHANYRDMQTRAQSLAARRAAAYRERRASQVSEDHAVRDASRSSRSSTVTGRDASDLFCSSSSSALSGSGEEREHEREEAPKKPRKPKPQPDMALFELFWEAYQKKVGKVKAAKEWVSKVGTDTELAERVIAAAQQFADLPDVRKEARKWQPHPSTWLHGEKWNDEIPGVKPVKTGPAKMTDDEYADSVQEYREANAEFRAEIRRGHVENLDHKNLRESDRKWLHDFIGFMDQIDREDPR